MDVRMPGQVVMKMVASLSAYAGNARTHSEAQVAEIMQSVRAFGWTNPLLVSPDGEIIAGHGRLQAAKQLGMAEVPCLVLDHLSDTQRRALVLADNQIALNAGWDEDLLAQELRDLKASEFDVATLGFGEDFLAGIFAVPGIAGLTDADQMPEPDPNPVSRNGEVWMLGRHRIGCGDACSQVDVGRLLGEVKPHLMVTDPPYGVNYDPTRTSDNPLKAGKVLNDDRADWREAWALFPGDVAYIWHASMHTHTVLESLEAGGFEHRSMIIWTKDRFTLGRGHYHWQHEPCWYVVRGGGNRTLERRPQADDCLANQGARGPGPRPRHAKARRVHAPSHREQQLAGAGGVRAIQRIWHHHHRRRADRPLLLRDGDQPALRGCGGAALGAVHRAEGHARGRWPQLRRDRCGARARRNSGPRGTAASRRVN